MFKFSLQRVLDLRAKREEAAAVTLVDARERAELARREAEELEQARADGILRVAAARGGGITVGQLQNLGLVLEAMDRRLASAHNQADQADAHVEDCMSAFTSASQDRRVLDRLREKHRLTWQSEDVLKDRKTMDAVALTRHARTQATANGRSE